jgi:Superinfection immunity protein
MTNYGWLLLLGAIGFYLLPFSIASLRSHKNTGAIFVLNLLLGWTLLGWVAAMVWAVSAQPKAPPPDQRQPCPFCKELIMPGAVVCRFCGRGLSAQSEAPAIESPHSTDVQGAAARYPWLYGRSMSGGIFLAIVLAVLVATFIIAWIQRR